MVLAILFFIAQIIFGLLVVDFFDPERKFSIFEKIITGSVLGLLISTFVILVSSLVSGSLYCGIMIFAIALILVLFSKIDAIRKFFSHLPVFKKQYNFRKIIRPENLWIIFIILITVIYYFYLSTVLFYGQNHTLRGALIGWGDNTLHIDMIERFANISSFNILHPGMYGVNLTYPFLINFISGIYLKLGADLVTAYRLPLFIFGICGMILLFIFASKILRSKNFAVLALVFVLLGSGLGFLTLFKDVSKTYHDGNILGVVSLLTNPLHEYTHLDDRTGGKLNGLDTKDNIVWIVPVVSFLSHQRSFSIGFAIFCILLLAIYNYGESRFFWRYGLIVGLLPFCHTHTFLAVFLMLAVLFWFFLKNWKSWISFALLVSTISLPQIFFLSKDSSDLGIKRILKPWFGWMTCNHTSSWFFCSAALGTDTNAFIFWLKNFGVIFLMWLIFLICAVVYLFFKKSKSRFNYGFIFASVVLFLVPNLFLLQPWPFDNNKVLFYWWILAIVFCVVPCFQFIMRQNKFLKVMAIILIFFGLFAGAFDFTARLFWTEKIGSFGYADSDPYNVQMGKWISTNTPADALFMTNPTIDPIPLFLAGRPVYLTFEGWLWTQGLDYYKNDIDEKKILSGDIALACSQNIKYILLDDGLINFYPGTNTDYLLKNTDVVFLDTRPGQNHKILKVNCSR